MEPAMSVSPAKMKFCLCCSHFNHTTGRLQDLAKLDFLHFQLTNRQPRITVQALSGGLKAHESLLVMQVRAGGTMKDEPFTEPLPE